MASMVGADVGRLRELAKNVSLAADQLESIRASLAPSVTAGVWKGPQADRFRGDWQNRIAPDLTRATDSLRHAAGTISANANEQEATSGAGGGATSGLQGSGSSGRGRGPAGTEPGASVLGSALTWGKALVGTASGLNKTRAFITLARLWTAADLAADVNRAAASAKVILLGDMTNVALGRAGLLSGWLSKLGVVGTTVGKWAGPIGGLFSIVGGVKDMVDPQHKGWMGWGDRIAGGLSVASGAGTIALALGAGAALGPVGVGAIVVAGAAAAAWSLGTMVYDHREEIGAVVKNVAGTVTSGVKSAGRAIVAGADAVGSAAAQSWDTVRSGAGKVSSFVKGLFH